MFFVYTVVLDKDLECSCKKQSRLCNLYMALPFIISFVLNLWVDKTIQRIVRLTSTICSCPCRKKCIERCKSNCKFILILFYEILKAAFIGVLWVTFLYVDGDWYVCCWNDGSEQQAQLACKNKKNITAEEKANIAELKSWSKIIGLSVLFCTLSVFIILSSFVWTKCCESRPDCSCCNRKIFYDELILEEEENVLKELLRGAAKQKLTQDITNNINGDDWKKCFDVAKNLIKKNIIPVLAKQQGEGSDGPDPTSPPQGTSRQQEKRSPAVVMELEQR